MYIKSCLRMLHELKAFLSQSRSKEKKRGSCGHRTREASYDVSEALKSATKQHQLDKEENVVSDEKKWYPNSSEKIAISFNE